MIKQYNNTPRVGVGVMIMKEGNVLLGKRIGSHGEGEYAFPGGHLEYLESFENCAKREVKEECGIEISGIRFQSLLNLTKYAPKHYVHIGLAADWKSGEPRVLEPEKCESWDWYDLDNLPEPIFEPCKMSIESYKGGNNYFDTKNPLLFRAGDDSGSVLVSILNYFFLSFKISSTETL